MPKTRRLSTRLFLLLSIWTVLAVVLVVLLITNSYRNTAETRLDELLTANIYNLMGGVDVDGSGKLSGNPELGDPRFNQFESGWYWSVNAVGSPKNQIRSISLAGKNIAETKSIALDDQFQRNYDVLVEGDHGLRVLEAQVFLGDGDTIYSFKVTGNLDVLNAEIRSFTSQLAALMALFGASIVLVSYFLVRIGLRPLANATDDLQSIRDGKADSLSGEYPLEIQPLIDETNALIKSNQSIIERARTQVGNLAHSLKTPLAVLRNEASSKSAVSKTLVEEQISQMQEQIQVYLDRARIAARQGTITSRSKVQPIVEQLVRVIGKLNPELNVTSQIDAAVIFHGEENDLQEILGNLVENAAKFAKQQVLVSAKKASASSIAISVEDDGIGLSKSDAKQAMKRGKRLDETKPGSGLGLSIVTDIVKEYDGDISISKSDLGGVKAEVTLAGSIRK